MSHLDVQIDEALGLVRAVRSRAPLGEGDVAAMTVHARQALAAVERGRFAVLVDLRAPSLADESRHAAAMTTLRRELTRGFRKAAFLVETPTGKLQISRFVREERLAAGVFDDEAKALAFLV